MIIPSVFFCGIIGDGTDHFLGVSHRKKEENQAESDKGLLHITGGLFDQDQAKVFIEP